MIITCELDDDCNLSDEELMMMNMEINVAIIFRITITITIIIVTIIVISTCEINDDRNLSENRRWRDVSVPHGGGGHYQEPEQVVRCAQVMLYWSVITRRIKGLVIKIQIA